MDGYQRGEALEDKEGRKESLPVGASRRKIPNLSDGGGARSERVIRKRIGNHVWAPRWR